MKKVNYKGGSNLKNKKYINNNCHTKTLDKKNEETSQDFTLGVILDKGGATWVANGSY